MLPSMGHLVAALATAWQAGLGVCAYPPPHAGLMVWPYPLGAQDAAAPPLRGLVAGAEAATAADPKSVLAGEFVIFLPEGVRPVLALAGEDASLLLGVTDLARLAAMAASVASCSCFLRASASSASCRLAAIAASNASRSASEGLLARLLALPCGREAGRPLAGDSVGSSSAGSWSAAITWVEKTVAIKEYRNNFLYI